MGFFDELGSVLGDLNATKNEVVDQVSQLGDSIQGVENPAETVQDTVQSAGEDVLGQGDNQN